MCAVGRVEGPLPWIAYGRTDLEGEHDGRGGSRAEQHRERAREQPRPDAREREFDQRDGHADPPASNGSVTGRGSRSSVSSETSPSRRLITRSAVAATRASWVTSRSVWPRSRA